MSTNFSHPRYHPTTVPPVSHALSTTPTETLSDRSKEPGNMSVNSISRSASYTQLSATAPPSVSDERNGIKRTFSENIMANPKTNTFRHASIKNGSRYNGGSYESNGHADSTGKQFTRTKAEPKITISKFTLSTEEDDTELTYEPLTRKKSISGDHGRKTRSVTGSISRFARQSWSGPPRSPSPDRRRTLERNPTVHDDSPSEEERNKRSLPSNASTSSVADSDSRSRSESGTVRRTKSRRPFSSLMTSHPAEKKKAPAVPPIPKSFSTDRLPISHSHTSSDMPPSLPKSKSLERLQIHGVESPRRKDDLLGAFRALDGEFQKFYSKSSNSKCAVVRSALLPFLRAHTEPLANFTLKAEDLDRRVNVLNRWWTGLLEMLNGRNGESVSGSDRPTVLDAVTAIMIRPEWNVSPSTSPLRSARPSLKSRSTTSLLSTGSDFLAESVVHNIRNTYAQNLLAQMAFVVDKMSVRNVPASVVTFCGRAAAYAFFYCNGVAEILVRLWSVSPDMLKRVYAANGPKRGEDLHRIVDKVSARFPACLRNLNFSSLRSLERHIRTRPQVYVATSYIPWNGPWTGRWAGRDTDLFYSFTKHYYDLLIQHLPDDYSQSESFCAPGHALVQAQLLTLLQGTIQRTNSQSTVDPLRGLSLDDPTSEADVSATVLPISPVSMMRSMAENRLIMLLRDCLSENETITPRTKELFAKSFENLTKDAASHISRFDHIACFTLCDFLEGAIVIFVRYYQAQNAQAFSIDWSFWLKVLQLMMESNNSMTEIRLCAFLYSLWGTLSSDGARRREICLEWLLNEETFARQFNHWCPMVRAFYMRLLIWRIGRLDGTASEDDALTLETLSVRLNSVWRHLLWLQERAKETVHVAPSTAPCSPAPSRCLVIMRNDQPTTPGMFLSFDSILSTSAQDSPKSASSPTSTDASSAAERPSSGGKRRWGILRSILPFSSNSPSNSRSSAAHNSSSSNSAGSIAHTKPQADSSAASTSVTKTTAYRSYPFKFSLEWFENGNIPSKNREISAPKLPHSAQLFLETSGAYPEDNTPLEPKGAAAGPSKYAGRALAEWALLITECQNFFERRKMEGVPDNSKVETPTLSVEPFRRPG